MPWCATGLSNAHKNGNVRFPKIWSGRARDFYVPGLSRSIFDCKRGAYGPKKGDVVVFYYGRDTGHVTTIDSITPEGKVITIGYNESDQTLKQERSWNEIEISGGRFVTPVEGIFTKIPDTLVRVSYYGEKFHGKPTANWKDKERFDMYALTAAHKTLPFGTKVKITNPDNGESVIVRINDRGPYSGDRAFDLSYAAAKRIGIIQEGVAEVYYEILK